MLQSRIEINELTRMMTLSVSSVDKDMERGSSVVECRIGNRESPVRIPFATVSKFGHFRSLRDASVDSAV